MTDREKSLSTWVQILDTGEQLTPVDLIQLISAMQNGVRDLLTAQAGLPERSIPGRDIGALQESTRALIDAMRYFVEGDNSTINEQLIPSALAYKIVSDLRKSAIEKQKEYRRKVEMIHGLLIDLVSRLSKGITNTNKKILLPLSEQLAAQKGIRMKDVAQMLSEDRHIQLELELSKSDLMDIFQNEDNEDTLSKLRTALKSEEGPSQEFKNLHGQRIINRTARLQVRPAEAHVLGERANAMIETLLKGAPSFRFNSEVMQTNDVEMLKDMLTRVPINADALKMVQSANAKLAIMRGQHLIDTQADSKYEESVLEEFRRVFTGLIHIGKNGKIILNPPRDEKGNVLDSQEDLEGNDQWMYLGRISIPEEAKSDLSRVRKIILSGREEVLSILDGVRAKFLLTQNDTPKNIKDLPTNEDGLTIFDLKLVKALGILISFFGGKPIPISLEYTALTGGTNGRSGGNHFSLHGVWSFQHRSKLNDIDNTTGCLRTEATPVEMLIGAFLTEIDDEEDHNIYKGNRNIATAEKLGVTMTFDEFTLDLMESIQTKHDFGFRSLSRAPEISKDIHRTFRDYHEINIGVGDLELMPEDVDIEKLLEFQMVPISRIYEGNVLLFLEILTRTKADSNELENYTTLLYIMRYHKAQLRNVINICTRWAANRGYGKFSTLIEQKAKILEGIMRDNLSTAPKTELVISSHGGSSKATVVADFGQRQMRRVSEYQGPVAMQEVDSGNINIKNYVAIFNGKKYKRMKGFSIDENSEGIIECHMYSNKGENLVIWTLVPSSNKGWYIPHRIIHKQVKGKDGKYMLVKDTSVEMQPIYFRNNGQSVVQQANPSMGMSEQNKKYYEAIVSHGSKK